MPEFDFEVGYRRLEAAMNGGADEVPFIVQMHEFSMVHMGQPGHLFYTDPQAFVRGICQTTVDYRFDTPSFIWDVYNVEAEALGLPLVLFEDMAPALDNVVPLIKDETDLARLKTPVSVTEVIHVFRMATKHPVMAEVAFPLTRRSLLSMAQGHHLRPFLTLRGTPALLRS